MEHGEDYGEYTTPKSWTTTPKPKQIDLKWTTTPKPKEIDHKWTTKEHKWTTTPKPKQIDHKWTTTPDHTSSIFILFLLININHPTSIDLDSVALSYL